MFFRKIEITNFCVYYGRNNLDFGRDLSSEGKNVYLIGGLNGAGKTSLLKAITLGLLGKNISYLTLDDKSISNYKSILQDSFSRKSLSNGEDQMSIKLIFEEQGKELVIERKWWFDDQGDFEGQEQLDIYKNGAPLEIDIGVDKEEVKEEFIETKIPPQIAKFFFFDGEEIRKIADKDPSISVRDGLNSLLGFAMLGKLLADLDKTKKEIRRETGKSASKTDLLHAEASRSEKEDELKDIKEELEDKQKEKTKSNKQFEIIKTQISNITGGDDSITDDKIQEEIEEFGKEEATIVSEISRFVGGLLCTALPRALLKNLKKQLTGELKKKEWEGKKNTLSPQKTKILEGLFGSSAPQPTPPLLSGQRDFLVNRLEVEWNDMFNPPPDGIAKNIIHTCLNEYDTNALIQKLGNIENDTQQKLLARIQRKNELSGRINDSVD